MYRSCCSGNFSSRSLGSSLCCPGSSCGSSCPSNLVSSGDLCSPSCYLWGPSLPRGCQQSCCRPRVPVLGSPCRTPPPGALGWGSRCSYSLSSGFCGFRPLGYGVCGVPALSSASGSCRPTYGTSGNCQSPCHRASCGSSVCEIDLCSFPTS